MTATSASAPALRLDRSGPVVLGGFALGVLLGFGGNFVAPGGVQDVMLG